MRCCEKKDFGQFLGWHSLPSGGMMDQKGHSSQYHNELNKKANRDLDNSLADPDSVWLSG